MNSRAVKIIVSLLLTVSLLCCSVSVFAVDGTDTVKAKETLVAYYIWQFLRAIGIDVTYQDILEYNDYIQDTILDWVVNYIGDLIEADSLPSTYTIDQWIAPWQVGYDYWGNLQYNSTMLEDLQDFASWLKSKLSLIDDDTIVINPVYSVNGYQLFLMNTFYAGRYDITQPAQNSWYDFVAIESAQDGNANTYVDNPYIEGWFPILIKDGNSYNYKVAIIKNRNQGQIRIAWQFLKSNDSVQRAELQTINANNWYESVNGYYTKNTEIQWFTVPLEYGQFIITDNMPIFETTSDMQVFYQNLDIVQEGSVKIVTSVIVMPVDNPDYIEGDGVTIIDGQPSYEVITFSGEVTNLPAIVSTGTVENPGIDQIYTNIPPLIEAAGNSMEIFRQIIFRMPDGILIALYALLSAGVVFGFLRIMREH